MYYYEKPAYQSIVDTKVTRRNNARHWYEVLGGSPPTPTRRKSMPVYMMIKKFI